MSIVIALTGPKGSGKDTVAQTIKKLYPSWTVNTVAFADPIKSALQLIFKLDPSNNDQYDLFKRTTMSFGLGDHLTSIDARHVVREIGMLMRSYDEQQFVSYVDQFLYNYDCPTSINIVTDMRFGNEFAFLNEKGAHIIKINRPGSTYDGHATESGFSDDIVDFYIENDGDLHHLEENTKSVVDYIIKEYYEACART
jgi:hypothetical protein